MKKDYKLSRREFIRNSSLGLAISIAGVPSSCSQMSGISQKPKLPMRTLGRTGLPVTILTYGGGSQFTAMDDGQWEPHMERAVQMGINLFDTSPGYQGEASMSSEERFGRILPKYRKQIILSTKVDSRDVTIAMQEFERSLKRFKTDYIDILMIHGINEKDDTADLERVYKQMHRLKDEGAVRFIGFSAMNDGSYTRNMLKRLDPDVAILTLNATKFTSMAKEALPVARQRNTGIIAMKVMRNIVGKKATARELLQYAWTEQGVATAVIGHNGIEPLEENYRLAMEFGEKGMVAAVDRIELERWLAPLAGPHALCWARPDYNDGMTIA
ncbi:MAG: aldo/keto reductase [Planctomycetes bacterium]|nr:aldo/keto reductase [Planctomycetota bacterium]